MPPDSSESGGVVFMPISCNKYPHNNTQPLVGTKKAAR